MVEATKRFIGGLKEVWRGIGDYAPSFRPRLSQVTKSIVGKHVKGNQALKNYRYPSLRRAFEAFRKYAVRTVLGILITYAVVLLVTWISPLPGPAVPENLPDYFRDFQDINLGLLGAQASFVGLVFPLVIAFVGLLAQGNTSSSERLGIYFQETSTVLTGGSSLALCFAILAQLPFAALFEVRVIAASTVLNLIWLAFNLVLLAHFLFRTIEYLRPKARTRLQKEYLANVAWPAELTRIVFMNQWIHAAKYGHLPGNPEDEDDELDLAQTRDSVHYGMSLTDGEPPLAQRNLTRDHVVSDVRFGLLRRLVTRWQSARGEPGDRRSLYFPLTPWSTYRGDVVLWRSSHDEGWAFRHHAKRSFIFTQTREVDGEATSSSLLSELVSDATTLLENGRADEFATQMGAILDLHAFLFEIAQSPEGDFSYAAMENVRGRTLATQWVSEYRDLQKRAVDVIARDPVFFRHCSDLGSRLMWRLDRNIAPSEMKSLNLLGYNAYYHLTNWAASRYRASGGKTGSPAVLNTLAAGADETYADAWREFVAGWEGLVFAEAAIRGHDENVWSELTKRREFLLHHLRLTAEMVGKSVWIGDAIATRWSADILLKWTGSAGASDYNHGHRWWALRRDNPTAALLGETWSRVLTQVSVVDEGEPNPRDVFSVALMNTTEDYTVVLTTILVHWSVEFGAEGAAGAAAKMLLRQQPFDRGRIGYSEWAPLSASGVLLSIWRIVGSSELFDEGYASQFEEFAERLGEFGDAPWVSQRGYMGSGGLGFSRLYGAHILTMMACVTPGEPTISEGLKRMFVHVSDAIRKRRLDFLRGLQSEFEHTKPESHGPALAALTADTGADLSFEHRRNWVKRLVDQLAAEIEQLRSAQVQQAEIDPDRILEIGRAASDVAFAKTGAFPLPLFNDVEFTAEDLEAFKISLANQQKGALTNPLMAQPVSNEAEWWSHTMKQQVASIVFRDVVNKTSWIELDGFSQEQFWSSLKGAIAEIKKAGRTPIIVTTNDHAPPWLADWQYSHDTMRTPRPADIHIQRDDPGIAGYRFSINGTPVYFANAPAGVVCVFAVESLERCRFHEYLDGLPVSVWFEPSSQDPWLGTTFLQYQRDVIVAPGVAYQVRFVAKDSSKAVGDTPDGEDASD